MKHTRILILLTLAFLHTASSVAATTAQRTAKQLQAATTINALGGELLVSKMNAGGVKNTMISSVSLYYALSVLECGAAGETAKLMRSTLLQDSAQSVADIAPSLAESLVHEKNQERPSQASFQLANAIWATSGETSGQPFVFSQSFKSCSATNYLAQDQAFDFLATGASSVLNDWASEKTNGLIPQIIDDITLQEFVWVVTNAAYYEGAWGTAMRLVAETPGYQFQHLDGSKSPARSIRTVDYKSRVLDQDDGSLAFSLPFYGNKYSFVAYVPSESEVNLEKWLLTEGAAQLPSLVGRVMDNRSEVYQLSVQIPVFSFSDGFEMRKGSAMVSDLGLGPLFTNGADFSLMLDKARTAPPLHETKIGLIKQNTRIELDEKGVKAAAVTLIGGVRSTTVAPRLPRRDIIVDRPFAFAIIENSSHTMLFNGVLTQPE